MSYDTLTENQKSGIDYQANHAGLSVEDYTQMRLVQDADRGYAELVSLQVAGIIGKLKAEPSIIPTVEAAVDAEVAVKVADREVEAAKVITEQGALPVKGLNL